MLHILASWAPVRGKTAQVAKEAVGLLKLKLEQLQQRTIDAHVMQIHGSRLSPASPVYQKIAQVCRAQCARGDLGGSAVHVRFSFVDNFPSVA